LIAVTIADLFIIRWMTKIDIKHVFNKIRMHSKENENLFTFKTKYETYKYLIMLFKMINDFIISKFHEWYAHELFEQFRNNLSERYHNV
jgi:hypothetical protein